MPVENKKLTKLKIANLKLDNDLKKKELKELKLKSKNENDIDEDLIKKVAQYKRIYKISNHRLLNGKTVGNKREIPQKEFYNFVLLSDELPKNEIEEAVIDLISPVLKSGNFYWKGFYNNDIINFQMADPNFKLMVQHGEIPLNNKVVLNTILVQDQKIDENGEIKVTKCSVTLVIRYSVNGIEYITPDSERFLKSK